MAQYENGYFYVTHPDKKTKLVRGYWEHTSKFDGFVISFFPNDNEPTMYAGDLPEGATLHRIDMPPPPKPRPKAAIIFDIDGTLADCEHRRHWVQGDKRKRDYHNFFRLMHLDTPNAPVIELCNQYYDKGEYIIICTGRPAEYVGITKTWLGKHNIKYNSLMMRPRDKSTHSDVAVKEEMLKTILGTRDVKLAVDDRQRIVDMWRSNDIPCFQVAPGNF